MGKNICDVAVMNVLDMTAAMWRQDCKYRNGESLNICKYTVDSLSLVFLVAMKNDYKVLSNDNNIDVLQM